MGLIVSIHKIGAFSEYFKQVQTTLAASHASEGSHYPTLKALLESFGDGVIATSLPSRIECGAPDFIVTKGSATVGYIEVKDIGKSLDETEKTEQLKRYLDSLSNLILTDYLEFRWYVDGERRLSARLGTLTAESKIKRDNAGIQAVAELLSDFLTHKAEAVGTPKELAMCMARQAHLIRNLIINAFDKEPEGGSLHSQLAAFRDNLIPDLSVDYFADMYAQTIAYGLFAARCNATQGKDFTRQNASYLLPKTNPFLRKLFNHIAGPDLDDRIAWLVDDLSQLLAQTDMESILKDFGRRSGKEDPVVHFYETFLKEYDPKIREMRGVYYTPEPVVSYIVRSIDHLLKDRFNKPQGLADEKTLILDPAVGTATFLYRVINEIHQATAGKGQQGLWNNYVAEKLLPRIFGFELLMAPYAVAHLKLGLLLQETGYEFKSEQRLGIYLTNTLEEAIKHSETFFAQWISEEANAAGRIKKDEPIMVVLGNPPYSNFGKMNQGEWIKNLMQEWMPQGEAKWNPDDFMKFMRWGQWRIERTGQGILAFITNHTYLDGITHRQMRRSLMETFNEIYVLDLHGNTKRKEISPDGSTDENVFEIQQGVCIGLFVKRRGETGCKVYHTDLWGKRKAKYEYLAAKNVETSDWKILKEVNRQSCLGAFYFFTPKAFDNIDEYCNGWATQDIFLHSSNGIETHRDEITIHDTTSTLLSVISDFRDIDTDQLRDKYKLNADGHDWTVSGAKASLRKMNMQTFKPVQILYRPFDLKYTYLGPESRGFIARPRYEVMQHMIKPNLGMVLARLIVRDDAFDAVLATRFPTEKKTGDSTRSSSLFPLYIYPAEKKVQPDKSSGKEGGVQDVMRLQEKREPNLNPEFVKAFSENLLLKFVKDGKGDLEQTFGPEDIFNYAYAVFHSPTYRTRYAEFLKIDFPRLPLTSDKELFKALAEKGAELVSLHLMESPLLNNLITRYPIDGSNTVEKVSYDDSSQRVYINKTQYFEGIPPEVWNFHIGGYQVCQKWLKDRKGRTLTYDELTHYQKMVVALKETIRLMAEIDELIPGWPVE